MAHQISPRCLQRGQRLNLLLLGKSGHGKSSTGNSILGSKQFVALGGGGSTTKEYQAGSTTVDGREVNVVDIPGLCDTECVSKESKADLVIQAIATGLGVFHEGFGAILLVMPYSSRMTGEEIEVFTTVKSILGEDALSNHAVLVFTHGDSFKNDFDIDEEGGYGNIEVKFRSWCESHKEIYGGLFEECEGRCVLFDNMTRDRHEKRSQIASLISTIDDMKSGQLRYTMNRFKAAGKTREELKLELRLPLIREKYVEEMDSIREFACYGVDSDVVVDTVHHFEGLKVRVESLNVNLPDTGHLIVRKLRNDLDNLMSFIETQKMTLIMQEMEIARRRRVQEEMEDERRKREKMRREQKEEEERHRREMRLLELRQKQLEDERRHAENDNGDDDSHDDSGCVIL